MVTVQQKIDLNKLLRTIHPSSVETENYITVLNAILASNTPNNISELGGMEVKTLTINFTKNSDITVSDVGLESSSLVVGQKYFVELLLLVNTITATPDIKLKFIGPGAATFAWDLGTSEDGLVAHKNINTENAIQLVGAAQSSVFISGILQITNLPGTLKLQAAQNTSTAENTQIIIGSMMRLTRIV